MSVYEFLGKRYVTDNSYTDEPYDRRVEEMTGAELVELHNLVNSNLGIDKRVNKFADKATAIKRVTAKLEAWASPEEGAEEPNTTVGERAPAKKARPAPKPKEKRRPRGMRFVFRPEAEIRECKGSIKSKSRDTRTLRQRAVERLLKGATFKDMVAVVEKFDEDRGATPKNVERRTYELIRLVHYYLGYGLKQEGEKIIAYSDPADAPPSISG